MTTSDNNYTQMQRHIYDRESARWRVTDRDPVVGSFDAHNAWQDYELLFEGWDTTNWNMLDFGCGPGRNLVKFFDRFASVSGIDISAINLEQAKKWLAYNNKSVEAVRLYHADGVSLNTAPTATFDVVMSTICIQHIPVYDIRYSIFTDMFRVLKPGGWLSIQMGYGDRVGASEYYDNFYDAAGTNGYADVKIASPDQPRIDLERIGFVNFSHQIRPVGPGDCHTSWIFFRAQKPL
jgi:ubiquinone/menaquinone biosynthesis C-methylase UbiE